MIVKEKTLILINVVIYFRIHFIVFMAWNYNIPLDIKTIYHNNTLKHWCKRSKIPSDSWNKKCNYQHYSFKRLLHLYHMSDTCNVYKYWHKKKFEKDLSLPQIIKRLFKNYIILKNLSKVNYLRRPKCWNYVRYKKTEIHMKRQISYL